MTAPTTPVELIGWRICCSVAFGALVVTAVRGWRRVREIASDWWTLGTLALGGVFVAVNWLLYVTAVATGHTVEGALGYFLNPLVSIVLALLVERERLRPLQWGAVGLATVAVVVLTVGYGRPPWIAIGLACSFGLYGLVKKRVGVRVDAIGGFFVETAILIPVGIACLVVAGVAFGGVTAFSLGGGHLAILAASGIVTALPLLLFAAATKRLTLVEVALMQYIAPITQFVIGVWVFHEVMPVERWIGFAIVWGALVLFSADLVLAGRGRGRGPRPTRVPESG